MKQTIRLTPQAWDLAEKHSLSLDELASVSGTGEEGRINYEDLRRYLAGRGRVAVPASTATQSPDMDAAEAQERRLLQKRWRVAAGIWIAWFVAAVIVGLAGGNEALDVFGALGFVVLLYAVPRIAVLEGRKWYEVFGLFVPIVNLIPVGRVIWYVAGRAVGVKPGAVRVPAPSPPAPDDARKKLAEQVAEAIRAADERAPH